MPHVWGFARGRITRSAPADGAFAAIAARNPDPFRGSMALVIGVPMEVAADEKRVATVPEVVEKLIKLGFSVMVQIGAGAAANCDDASYRAAGATIADSAPALWSG